MSPECLKSSWCTNPWAKKSTGAGRRLCGWRDARFHYWRRVAAALAYGTQTVPKVDKITGPGNAYALASAKSGTVGIDMIAGPSEILVLADGSTPADWVAWILLPSTSWRKASCCVPTRALSTRCKWPLTAC